MAKPNIICATCKGAKKVDRAVLDSLQDHWNDGKPGTGILGFERKGKVKCPTCKGKGTLGKA